MGYRLTMFDISNFMDELAVRRPLFHSEADMQHAFAWHLHEHFPQARIRLEYPVILDSWIYLDIWLDMEDESLAVELKYKTALLDVQHGDEPFRLKNQAAQLEGRYDFVKDVQRLEQIVRQRPNTTGLALMLTNDSGYWSPPTRPNVYDAAFRLYDQRRLHGMLSWDERAALGTTRGREAALNLLGRYDLKWRRYSKFDSQKNGEFLYLAVNIDSSRTTGS
jgi:hypothetical protein